MYRTRASLTTPSLEVEILCKKEKGKVKVRILADSDSGFYLVGDKLDVDESDLEYIGNEFPAALIASRRG